MAEVIGMTGDKHVAVHGRRLRDRACQRRPHRLACRIVHAGVALKVHGDRSIPDRAVSGHHLGRPPRSHKVEVVHRHRRRVRHHACRRRHCAQC